MDDLSLREQIYEEVLSADPNPQKQLTFNTKIKKALLYLISESFDSESNVNSHIESERTEFHAELSGVQLHRTKAEFQPNADVGSKLGSSATLQKMLAEKMQREKRK